MKRTGELLKNAREERGLSLHEVALFLKINSRVLMAIEEGDQAALPARTFLRGFIQSYAKFLKLDPGHVLQVFTEENAPPPAAPIILPNDSLNIEVASPPPTAAEIIKPQHEVRNDAESLSLEKSILTKSQVTHDKLQFKTIAISILGLILVGVLYFANNMVKKYQKEAQVEPVQSIESLDATENQDAPVTAEVPDEKTSTEKTPTPTPVPVEAPVVAAPTPAAAPAPAPVVAATPPVVAAKPSPTPAPPAPTPEPVAVATPVNSSAAKEAANSSPLSILTSSVSHPLSSSAPTVNPVIPQIYLSTAAVETKPKPATQAPETPFEKTSEKLAEKPVATTPPAAAPVVAPAPAPAPAVTPPPAEAAKPVAEKPADKPAEKPTEVVSSGKPVEVIVEATDAVEIEYSSAKSAPQKLMLKADQVHTFKSRSGIKLKISNGGAVNLIVNGRDVGAPGGAGQSVQVAY